jgi:hypothetical protein
VRFSFFGNFARHKGVHTLLAALPLLRNRGPFRLNLIGEGSELDAYQLQLKQNRCGALVRFWGKLENNRIGDALAETDVLVLPSIWRENQPVSICEAMACGIPVIASNLGGIPELVEHGKTGYLFAAGNAAELAARMGELIASPALIESFGQAARARMLNHAYSSQARRLLDLYEQLIEPPSDTSRPDIPLIVGLGQRVDETSAQALALLPYYHQGPSPRVVMADWLTEAQTRLAYFLWVMGETDQWAVLALASKLAVPLLVTESQELLAAQCRRRQCGLYFSEAHEAAACIAYLLSHRQERETMGNMMEKLR